MALSQVWPKFGKLVRLIVVSIKKMVNFLLFMLIWVIYFALSYYILGSEIDGGDDFSMLAPKEKWNDKDIIDEVGEVGNDYSDLGYFFKYIILTWRNSIGDLSVPSYEAWAEIMKQKIAHGNQHEALMIGGVEFLIWGHWFGI